MSTSYPISHNLKLRFGGFILAIVVMVTVIVWIAQSSWRRIGELRDRLDVVQSQSFRIADYFLQNILSLDNAVIRFEVTLQDQQWTKFEADSKVVDHWIDEEIAGASTQKEKEILARINAEYDDYLAAAKAIHTKAVAGFPATTRIAQYAPLERHADALLNLGFDLAKAHRESLDQFLSDSRNALGYLRVLLSLALFLLLLAGAGLAVLVYRGLVAPLSVKLVESQRHAERHEKLASLGMLAAGVAHEIRNPLTAIKAWLFIQRKHMAPGTAEYEDAEVIASEISRLERIVQDFLLFARPSEPRLQTIPAEEPLREVEALMTPQFERFGIRLGVEAAPAASVRVDPQQIKQVLINLVQNAADSIGKDGTITLRARQEQKRLKDRIQDVVILEVSDTGKGIPPDVEKRLFDPFFTTKDDGTGLGLSIASRIIERHGGALQYQTRVNHGTVFGIVLPRA